MYGVFDRLRQFVIAKYIATRKGSLCFNQPKILPPKIEFIVGNLFLIEELDWPPEIDRKICPLVIAQYADDWIYEEGSDLLFVKTRQIDRFKLGEFVSGACRKGSQRLELQ